MYKYDPNDAFAKGDALELRLHGLKSKIKAPAHLTSAAVSGIPYRPAAHPFTHIYQITKGALIYAMSVILLLGGIFFTFRLLDETEPAGTIPSHSTVLPPTATTTPDSNHTEDTPVTEEIPVDASMTLTLLEDGTWGVAGYDNKDVTEIVIPAEYNGKAVTQILQNAFEQCEELVKITLPEGITAIGYGAFQRCDSLKEINFPASLRGIGAYAFSGCYALQRINFPDGLETIGIHAFEYSYLEEAIIPDSVTQVGDGCFYNCSKLRKAQMPAGETTVRGMVFQGCSALAEVILPDSVGTIGSGAFKDCASLRTVALPSAVCYIEFDAFHGCDRLTSVEFGQPNDWVVQDYPSYVERYMDPLTSPEENAQLLKDNGLLDTWRRIRVVGDCRYYYVTGGVAFSYKGEDKSMTEYVIPESLDGTPVTQVWGSFANCTRLERVTIPDTVTYIGSFAFNNCTSLKQIDLPPSLNHIEESAFEGCGLVSVTLPATLADSYASTFKNCTALQTVVIEESVTEICKEMFYGCTSLTEIVLPSTVTLIERDAFAGCTNLTRVVFSDPEGWNVEQDISDPAVAAKLLTQDYIFLQWSKS